VRRRRRVTGPPVDHFRLIRKRATPSARRLLVAGLAVGTATLLWLLIGASTLMLGVATFWAMRTARLRAAPLDAAYDALCTKLARIGAPRGDSEGPLDYASRLHSTPPLSDRCAVEVQRLFAEYVGLRYARAFPTGEGIAGFARDVYRLRLETRN